jgi:hypothetical protein
MFDKDIKMIVIEDDLDRLKDQVTVMMGMIQDQQKSILRMTKILAKMSDRLTALENDQKEK